MTQKAFFFDLDGTLAVKDQPASNEDIEAIRAVRHQGHLVFLCTGRAPCHVYGAIRNIGFDGEVSGAGTHVTLGSKTIYRRDIDPDIIRRVILFFLENGGFCILEGEQNLYSINPRSNSWESDWPVVSDPDDFTPGKGKYAGQAVLKFSAFAQTCRGFSNRFRPEFEIIDHGNTLECVPAGSNKAEGMRVILDAVGIERADSVAFGDSPNDLDMLKYAGVGIAMGDAPDIVKAAADMVTAPLLENGVAKALEKYKENGWNTKQKD